MLFDFIFLLLSLGAWMVEDNRNHPIRYVLNMAFVVLWLVWLLVDCHFQHWWF